MRELRVVEIRVSTGDEPPLVVLAEVGGSERRLPVWMSHGGASAIFSASEAADAERPAIHDLAHALATSAGESLLAATITRFADGQFYAELSYGDTVLPARPSDAIALALRAGCPIQCPDALLDEIGVSATETAVVSGEAEVERFLEFLDSVAPEDFGEDQQP